MTVLVWHWCGAVMVLVCLTWNCCGICSMMVNHKVGGGRCCPYQLVLELLLSLQPWWLVSLAPCVASHCARGLLAPQAPGHMGLFMGSWIACWHWWEIPQLESARCLLTILLCQQSHGSLSALQLRSIPA